MKSLDGLQVAGKGASLEEQVKILDHVLASQQKITRQAHEALKNQRAQIKALEGLVSQLERRLSEVEGSMPIDVTPSPGVTQLPEG